MLWTSAVPPDVGSVVPRSAKSTSRIEGLARLHSRKPERPEEIVHYVDN
jgi:hypothetical protein